MNIRNIFFSGIMLLMCSPLFAQPGGQGSLKLVKSGSTYQVIYRPSATSSLYPGTIITVNAPANAALPTNLTGFTSVAGTFVVGSSKGTNAGLNLWSFVATSEASGLAANTDQILFTFTNSAGCSGGSFNISQNPDLIIGSLDYSTYGDNGVLPPSNPNGAFNTFSNLNSAPCASDTDGDGVADDTDVAPNDPCLPAQSSTYTAYDSTNTMWRAGDCDGDGVNNGQESTNMTNPYSNDTDSDGVPDGTDQCPTVPGVAPTGCAGCAAQARTLTK